MILQRLFYVALGVMMANAAGAAQGSWSLNSPNGKLHVGVNLKRGALSYTATLIAGGRNQDVVKESPLGFELQDQDFASGLGFKSLRGPAEIKDSYTLTHGKRVQCANTCQEITLVFRNQAGGLMELDFRAYDDGVTFRYRVPGNGAEATFKREFTGFAVPGDAKLWAAPSDKAGMYSPAYETYYENGVPAGTVSPSGFGWSFPMLYRTAGGVWALLSESAVNEQFCGSRLSSGATNGVYSVDLPTPGEGNGTGAVQPTSKLPWVMPWRVIIAGASLGTIFESTLITDVHPPQAVADTSWIRPGRVAWSWWSDNPSPRDVDKQRKFIDLAAEMGWEYVLVDANWTIMEKGNIHEVLRYGKEKGVGILLWYNSGGPHNLVTEKPRDTLTYPSVRKFELDMLKEWGVKGIKVDFFQSDKQDVIGVYQGILRDAAERKIMVNFHGCTLPRGWERQYPNLMSMEGVRGAECYIFDEKYPDMAPVQNTILPFTRNVVGPMDYTPVTLSDHQYPHKTTAAHELALAVLFQSGWLHLADRVEAYTALPEVPKRYLKEVPVAWDETRFVDGEPGQFAIVARRKGNTWYVAGANGRTEPKDVSAAFGPWLKAGSYNATVISDGAAPRDLATKEQIWASNAAFPVKMAPRGGFVAILKPR